MIAMKRLLFGFMIVCAVLAVNSLDVGAQNKVVVIPLFESATGPPAPVAKTGQTDIDTTVPGEDGVLAKGVAWPSPRFTDNGDGTVTDNLTDLIWLRNADCDAVFRRYNGTKLSPMADSHDANNRTCQLVTAD